MKLYVVVLSLLVAHVAADMYMHNPPGSNCRNRERSDNRNNGDRMFDSQNNGKGGYHWRGDGSLNNGLPDPIVYYGGSILRIEWTNQHGSGDCPNVAGHVIIQYACDAEDNPTSNNLPVRDPATFGTAAGPYLDGSMPGMIGLRDGYPTGAVVARDTGNPGYTRARFAGEGSNGGRDQNRDGTKRIENPSQIDLADNQKDQFYYGGAFRGIEFGMHESHKSYQACKFYERNHGLYNADQKLNNNAGARATRQNPNGARRGLECPEERDYYPYWNGRLNHWRDVAVLVDNPDKCEYFQSHSANIVPYGWCSQIDPADEYQNNYGRNQQIPITPAGCAQDGGIWNPGSPNGGGVPDCQMSMTSRDNHLGNAVRAEGSPENSNDPGGIAPDFRQPETAHYLWTVPDLDNVVCTLRVRYNMSSVDYPSQDYALAAGTIGVGADSSLNCPRVTTSDGTNVDDLQQAVDANVQCTDLITAASRPLFNRPYVNVFPNDPTVPLELRLSIAINTNQNSRTFQDRSHAFKIKARPIAETLRILNLNIRGRRGNIVQAYPSVEYDFVPSVLTVTQFDVVHLQFHGSEFNNAKNANNGEGWQYSDRCNLVQMELSKHNFPIFVEDFTLMNPVTAKKWALLDQDVANCDVFKNGDNNEQNDINNCGKLNQAPARFPLLPEQGLLTVANAAGTYAYVSTRNNNFSNRSHKGQMVVDGSPLSASEIAGIVAGSVVGASFVTYGVFLYGFHHPNTVAGSWFAAVASKMPCCLTICGLCGGSAAGVAAASGTKGGGGATRLKTPKTVAPPDMEYTRH